MTTVTDGYGGDLDPSISPSGDRVVFSSSRTGDRHLWTARLDGADMRPLTSGNALDDRPAFSPDGRQVAFNSDRDGRRGIWIIGAEGGTPRKVADVSATGGLSWSPDGTESGIRGGRRRLAGSLERVGRERPGSTHRHARRRERACLEPDA